MGIIVGQKVLKSIIDSHIENKTFPRTVMLEGAEGCGKHLFCSYIADNLKVELYDLTTQIELEVLNEISLSATPRLYMINCKKITVKEQNIILKFIEEPLRNSYVVLLVENKNLLLETVVNRCIRWQFEKYESFQLREFLEDNEKEYVLGFAETPGEVIEFQNHRIQDMKDLANKMLTRMGAASYSNILTIVNRINFKDKEELFDFEVFLKILLRYCCRMYIEGKIPYIFYELTNTFCNESRIPNINKQHLFENYLFKLRQAF